MMAQISSHIFGQDQEGACETTLYHSANPRRVRVERAGT